MDNKFCVNCDFYSEIIGHCVYGFSEFQAVSPTICEVYGESEKAVSKKDFICHGCMNMDFSPTTTRPYCIEGQVFFNTKKAEGCKKYIAIEPADKSGSSVIYLPPPKKNKNKNKFMMGLSQNKERYELESIDFCISMVK